MGSPAPIKRSSPPGPEAGEGEKKAIVITFYNTNGSPLWELLGIKLLNMAEGFCEDEYWSILGGLCGAKVVLLFGQANAPTGILALSEDANIIELPVIPSEWFADKKRTEVLEWISGFSPEVLAKMVFEHHQKTKQQ
jgi:hypothetical protein